MSDSKKCRHELLLKDNNKYKCLLCHNNINDNNINNSFIIDDYDKWFELYDMTDRYVDCFIEYVVDKYKDKDNLNLKEIFTVLEPFIDDIFIGFSQNMDYFNYNYKVKKKK